MTKVSASLLASDLSRLLDSILTVEEADRLHIDIMDGHFVPNISMGFPIIESFQDRTNLPIDVHLMVTNPVEMTKRMSALEVERNTIHVEATDKIEEFIRLAETAEMTPGLAINPETDFGVVEPYLTRVDRITVMGVTPGFSGQEFQPEVIEKIERVAESPVDKVEVDGGVTVENAKKCVDAGANVLVSGSAIFESNDKSEVIDTLRNPAITET